MRGRGLAIVTVSVAAGLALGALLSPPPADAVAKEIIQLQQQVSILMQNQQTMQNEMTQSFAVLKTLVGQVVDSQNQLAGTVGSMQKTIQNTQANSGSQINTMASQVQALSDSLEDVKARIGKLSGQLATAQNSLQTIDAKVSALGGGQTQPGASSTGPGPGDQQQSGAPNDAPPSQGQTGGAGAPASPSASAPPADLLYTNGLRDFTAGNYDLANQEFQQYLQFYGKTDLASNAHFYLGEIAYVQGRYPAAIGEYNQVLNNYPNSFKRADARLKKAYALLKVHENGPAVAELRRVIRDNPGTEQARKAEARLKELGVRAR
ncbi:MAG: tetratricopeptide repeat protein [Acidobacteriota bacterium]|nr:tetratricopeptide repeat protein [Acidobacteriota bacterium]